MKRLQGDEYALIMYLSARDKFMLKHLGITEKQLDEYVKIQALRIKGKNRWYSYEAVSGQPFGKFRE